MKETIIYQLDFFTQQEIEVEFGYEAPEPDLGYNGGYDIIGVVDVQSGCDWTDYYKDYEHYRELINLLEKRREQYRETV